jgi:chitin synthase
MDDADADLATLGAPGQTAAAKAPTIEALATALHNRLARSMPYTMCGEAVLVCVNPAGPLENLNDAHAEAYEREAQVASQSMLPPHPFDMASRVYAALQSSGKPQAIIYTCVPVPRRDADVEFVDSGIAGSGKTFVSNLIMSQLIRIAGTTMDAGGLREQLDATDVILTAFGTAAASDSEKKSCFGRYVELHYDSEGSSGLKLGGAQITAFGLDKWRASRATLTRAGQSTFQVFRALVGGATEADRQDLALRHAGDYVWLDGDGNKGGASQLALDAFRNALAVIGLKTRSIKAILRTLSAILLLNEIEFDAAPTASTSASVAGSPGARPALEIAAALLGLPSEGLEQALVNRSRYLRRELCTVLVDIEGAKQQRNSLCANLYSILFDHLVGSCNARLSSASPAMAPRTIAALDIPGMHGRAASSRGSTLVQSLEYEDARTFFANLQVELLQSFAASATFEAESVAAQDGVPSPPVELLDRFAGRIELLRGGQLGNRADADPNGLLGALVRVEAEVRRGKVSESDAPVALVAAFRAVGQSSSAFVAKPHEGSHLFAIRHYNDHTTPVSYSAANFLDLDMDQLDVSFVGLMRASDNSMLAKQYHLAWRRNKQIFAV